MAAETPSDVKERGYARARVKPRGGVPGPKTAVNAQRDAQLWSAVALQQHLAHAMHRGIAPPSVTRPSARMPAPTANPGRTPGRPRLTLAQKMGLAPAPPEPLSQDDWTRVEAESRRRGDSKRPCSICYEPFGLREQCILSCSHVFHKECIQAFEKFQRSGRGCTEIAACPLCRQKDYQTHAHTGGSEAWREHAALTIQRTWRGYCERQQYNAIRLRTNPDYLRQRQLAAVAGISDHELRQAEARERDIDDLFERLDAERAAAAPGPDWERARNQLLCRGVGECAICLGSLLPEALQGSEEEGIPAREAVLLSCSHAFHLPCLASFEEYERCAHATAKRCPVCRSQYETTPLYVDCQSAKLDREPESFRLPISLRHDQALISPEGPALEQPMSSCSSITLPNTRRQITDASLLSGSGVLSTAARPRPLKVPRAPSAVRKVAAVAAEQGERVGGRQKEKERVKPRTRERFCTLAGPATPLERPPPPVRQRGARATIVEPSSAPVEPDGHAGLSAPSSQQSPVSPAPRKRALIPFHVQLRQREGNPPTRGIELDDADLSDSMQGSMSLPPC